MFNIAIITTLALALPQSGYISTVSVANPLTVSNWVTCRAGIDACASSDYQCCIGPVDVLINKSTCRLSNFCASQDQLQSKPVVQDWVTCGPNDKCASSGFTCCVAPSDFSGLSTDKATCRDPSMCAGATPNSPIAPASVVLVPNYGQCTSSSSQCASPSFKCCVAQNDFNGSYKQTCRASSDCYTTPQPKQSQQQTPSAAVHVPAKPAAQTYSNTQSAALTYYDPSTGGGACTGHVYSKYDMIVAVSSSVLHSQNLCGKQITLIAPNGNSAKVTVVDECDENGGCVPGTIDGTQSGVWGALGLSTGLGRVGITWTV